LPNLQHQLSYPADVITWQYINICVLHKWNTFLIRRLLSEIDILPSPAERWICPCP
jgi:hypothetical protein